MKQQVQSLSICVPAPRCINKCKFCVSCMHDSSYEQNFNVNNPRFDLYFKDYIRRMKFAKENDANTIILTGEVEPLQNRSFLHTFAMMNNYVLPQMGCSSFNWIEIQSSGVCFDSNYARFLRETVGVSVFSFSLSSFDDGQNAEIVGMPSNRKISIHEVCEIAKEYGFTLRLSLNMSDLMIGSIASFTDYQATIEAFFNKAIVLHADQVTFRKLYSSGNNAQSQWVHEHQISDNFFVELNNYIHTHGKLVGVLPYGFSKYVVHGISVVVDEDCMNEEKASKGTSKYFVLRPDCKLYEGWNSEDLLF